MSPRWLFKLLFRNAFVAPALNTKNYFYENFGDHGANEAIYQHIFLRSLREVGIDDQFAPVGGAASYSLLYILLKSVSAFKPQRAVELGAGQSTILLEAMRKRSLWTGSLQTLEEDRVWATAISARTGSHVIYAPLSRRRVHGRNVFAYDNSGLGQGDIDFLLIDGPRGTPRWSRFAATEYLGQMAKDRFLVIMDDHNRFGEQQTMGYIETKLRQTHGQFAALTIRSSKHQRILIKGMSPADLLV